MDREVLQDVTATLSAQIYGPKMFYDRVRTFCWNSTDQSPWSPSSSTRSSLFLDRPYLDPDDGRRNMETLFLVTLQHPNKFALASFFNLRSSIVRKVSDLQVDISPIFLKKDIPKSTNFWACPLLGYGQIRR